MIRNPYAVVVLALTMIATPAAAQTAGQLSNPGGSRPAPPAQPAPPTPPPATPPATGDVPAPPGADVAPLPDEFADVDTDETAPEAPPGEERMRLLVIDAAVFGVDPVVGRVASAQMRATGEALGYQVLGQAQTVAAAQQLQMPYPPTPADLWRVSWVARVHRGAFARIWSHAGQYVIEVSVASLDGAGPFFARGTAGSDDFRESVDRLLRTALPAPSVWTEAQQPPPPEETPGEPVAELDDFDDPPDDTDTPPRETPPAEPEPELRRWSLALQTEASFGVSSDFFYNHLIGLRLDFRITRDILLGVLFSYANVNARNGRADNIFFMLQFEDRIRISSDIDLTIPLRAAVGYLPFNGPVIRLAAGLNYAVSPDWEIGADLIVPTFWILADGGTAVSLDVGLEVSYRF